MLATSSSATQQAVIGLGLSLAALVFVLYRQLQVRRLSSRYTVPVILVLLGVISLTSPGPTGLGSASGVLILAGLLLIDAAGLGALRAWTVRLWRTGDAVFRQGTRLTAALWLLGVVIHAAVDGLAGISDSTLLLYLGVSYGVQQLVLQARAQQPAGLPQRPPLPGRDY